MKTSNILKKEIHLKTKTFEFTKKKIEDLQSSIKRQHLHSDKIERLLLRMKQKPQDLQDFS